MPIVRQTRVLFTNDGNSSADFTIYTYPFNGFPLLKSHLHPKFAIFEAGRRLEFLEPTVFKSLLVKFPSLALIGELYGAWSRKPPAEWKTDISFYDPDDTDDGNGNGDPDYDSDQTSIGRHFWRKHPAQSSLTPQTKRQRRNPQPRRRERLVQRY